MFVFEALAAGDQTIYLKHQQINREEENACCVFKKSCLLPFYGNLFCQSLGQFNNKKCVCCFCFVLRGRFSFTCSDHITQMIPCGSKIQ